ncbi:MAG TPA: nuclear transport factor 2 family protein [Solirubrobacteraceae bacterium]|jgi:ketosteroid isomerase-like protein|nr:nuclear transport factor 2 family protein [Solirubrobacteraceae bacterium]
MSDAYFELITAGIAAFNEGDFDRVADMFAVDGELQRAGSFGTLRGREAIRAWVEPDAVEFRGITVTALQRSGDHILATCDVRIRGIGSGAEVATTLYLLFKFRDHRVLRLAIYFQQTEALAAATLTTS